ncbi:phytanoyl-CoA dioxygenase family protein [Streptomyces sp. A7024]|uniref:Phytanoyl-CoA dioxygenase family protein n=1 Tax=Streptomyces coryli TaxID=1128680 RepID=A0A6G4TRB8_9ACTN|nr:phytanoyl-CoA dioxygenase family protein [Streptomyces coryli]NGN62535.1 phytanoyl-CoA dioxygenase family protein [Streptomyces coryli]
MTPVQPGHLTDEQIAAFDRDGYLVLRDRIPPSLLARLQAAADGWIAAGRGRDGEPDYEFADRPAGRALFRVDYLHAKGDPASLELLGSPALLGIAESLAGPDFVPTYESLVFKDRGDGAPIAWHQDAVHPRAHRIFNCGVYLDPSRAGAGALRVLPGSQRGPADICALTDAHGWEPSGVVEVELAPGDVLLHDVMLVHGSPPVRGNALRRTLYFEFRPAEQILAEGPWDLDWVRRRMRLLPPALARHHRAHPDVTPFAWRAGDQLRPAGEAVAEAEHLRVAHEVHTPGTHCSAGGVT